MNSWQSYWESDEAFAFRHDDFEIQAKQAYIAGLMWSLNHLKRKYPDFVDAIDDFEAEANEVEKGH